MRILWFVSTIEDTRFLKEFEKYCDHVIDVFNINFITRFDLKGFKGTQLLPRYKSDFTSLPIEDDLSKVFNVLSGRLTLKEAEQAYRATIGTLESYLASVTGEKILFVIPSGRHVHHVAATSVAKKNNLARIYINYSNFPGYTFFDPEGTDCLASIFRDPERLNRLYADREIDVEATFTHFANLKHQQKSIPQKATSGFKAKLKNSAFLVDTVLQYATRVVCDRRIRLSSGKNNTVVEIDYSPLDASTPFAFFPLQVSTDQQVLVNYDGGSIYKAIDEAYSYSKSKGLTLYVREHPAESNKDDIRAYLKTLTQYDDFKVADASVSELISGCREVITINSTVGLESRINRKPVHFLGKSFYAKATDIQLAYYLECYFVPVDYHNPRMKITDIGKILTYAKNK